MTREDILKELNYQGRYTKEIKKKLNKLIKEYHPDNNKNDKKTILILYDIKKELEKGTLKYSKPKIKITESHETTNYTFFLEMIIERLKKQRDRVNDKINSIYKKMNAIYEKQNNKQKELTKVGLNINELEDDIEDIKRIDLIDFFIGIVILFSIIIIVIYKNYILSILTIIFILLEIYYIYVRLFYYNEITEELKKVKEKNNVMENDYNSLEQEIKTLEQEEIILKREKGRISNDIEYYTHEMNKINDHKYTKEKTNEKDEENIFVKK